jgi:hypothetical protein
VPWVSSPVLAYRFSSGLYVTVGLLANHFTIGARVGSDFRLNCFQGTPWGFGINLFALAVLLFLVHARSKRPAEGGGT